MFQLDSEPETQVSDPIAPAPQTGGRDRSLAARKAARREKAERERRIVDGLKAGLSVAEMAAREKIGERGMRKAIGVILARHGPEASREFIALQVARLNESLIASFGALASDNLQAVDRVVRIVRGLDRYHGFSAAQIAKPKGVRGAASDGEAAARRTGRNKRAPQAAENSDCARRNGGLLSPKRNSQASHVIPAKARVKKSRAPQFPSP